MTRLLVATSGGHLAELLDVAARLPAADDVWVTSRTPMAEAALAGRDTIWVPYVHSREWRKALAMLPTAIREVRRVRPTSVVSTGAAVAVPWLLAARTLRVPSYFVDSATRISDHSMTGRMVARIPGVHVFAQYPELAEGRWGYRGSVFDGYRTQQRSEPTEIRRVVVTLGQSEWGFRRLVERLVAILPAEADVVWQTGSTDVSGLPLTARAFMPADDLAAAVARADLVVAHAGVGTAMGALRAGRCPVLVPRRGPMGEHVDDHQVQLAEHLAARGLAITADAGALTADDLARAAALAVVEVPPAPFDLAG